MIARLSAIARKEFIQLLRDRRTLISLIVAPLIQLIVFGYVATTDIKQSPAVICDENRSARSRELVERFVSSGYFEIAAYIDGRRDIDDYLDSGDAVLGIVIPPDFDENIGQGKEATIGIYIDGTNSNLATIVSGYVEMIIAQYSRDLTLQYFRKTGLPFNRFPESEPRVWFNPELKSANFMVPGVMAMLTLILLLNLTTMAVVREREQGTAEQLAVTPIKALDLLGGKLLPPLCMGYIIITLVLIVGILWFRIAFVGSIILLYFLSAFFILASLSAGLFISSFSYTGDQAMLANQVFAIPNILLSGFIFPISNMPEPIQMVTYLLPMRYYLVIIRGLFLRGSVLADLWQEAAILLVWGLAVFYLASLRLKRKLV
jgi:ABC-2 type transport system permease protein